MESTLSKNIFSEPCHCSSINHQQLVTFQLPPSTNFTPDGITERIRVCDFTEFEQLTNFLVDLFTINRRSIGAVTLAYSCILTRGIDRIRRDYDIGSIESLLTPGRLLCTQELINLMLIGRAVSNVFDRNFAISSELILHGINRRSLLGFLTIHEHDGASKVGVCYKNPILPIFIVLSDYHFTLLFSKQQQIMFNNGQDDDDILFTEIKQNKSYNENRSSTKYNDNKIEINNININNKGSRSMKQHHHYQQEQKIAKKICKAFDLYYYDGLVGQNQEIRLTIGKNTMQQEI